jgi:hypothetical protein
MGTPAAVKVGPGLIYVAKIGTTEPTTVSATLPSANWVAIGYTEEGSTFTTETTYEDVMVAEELDPIRVLPTARVTTFEFQMAEISAQNWNIAMNGGTIGTPTTGYVTFEPPALGVEQRLMVVWNSDDNQERLLLRQAVSTGAIAVPRRKAPDKALIPIAFKVEKPTTNLAVFKLWEPSSLSYTNVYA